MKNIMMLSMEPEELEAMIRKLLQEERQDHPIPFMQPGKSLLFRKNKLIAWQEEEEQIAKEKIIRKQNWMSIW